MNKNRRPDWALFGIKKIESINKRIEKDPIEQCWRFITALQRIHSTTSDEAVKELIENQCGDIL